MPSLAEGALAAVLLLPLAAAAEPAILVLNEANAPPYSTPLRTGFFDVVAREALRRAGIGLRIATVPAGRSLLLSSSGASDGELNRTAAVSGQYPSLIRVPEKLGDLHFAAFSRNRAITGNFDAIRKHSVGLIRGWRFYEREFVGKRDVIAANDPEQLFRLLQLGRIEVALWELHMGNAYLRAHAMTGIHGLDPAIAVIEEFIYLHARHAALVPAISAALLAMKRDGTYEKAYRDAFGPHLEERPR